VRALFADYAATIGLDVERFKKDMDRDEVKGRIKADQERSASIGVDRTPVLFIDGVQIPFSSFSDEKQLRGIIDAALSGKPPLPAVQSPTPAQSN
jgi:predicted DsbA family dithiol-disulfide isomerase